MSASESNNVPDDRPVAEVDLAITGMTCAACVARVEKKLNKIDGARAVVNLATERAHIELFSDVSDAHLIEVVEKAGYGAALVQRSTRGESSSDSDLTAVEQSSEKAAKERIGDLRRRLIVSAVASVPIVVVSMIPALEFPGWQWLVGGLALLVAVWCAFPFHRNAARAIRYGSTTMDTLVSLGVIASMGWSLWALLWGGAGRIGYTMAMSGVHSTSMPHLYFESVAMIVTFLLAGRLLEARSRRSAGSALRSLLEMGASEAMVIRHSEGVDVEERIPARQLVVGDVFRVRPGEKIATDGVVLAGHSAVDTSLVTGESVPVSVEVGSEVIGGTLNTFSVIDVQATRVGEDTTLSAMGRLLTEAQTGKAPVQRLADRISSVFVPIVITLSVFTFVIRFFALHNPLDTALTSAIAVLVVACPCALGLATPTALLVGSGRASQLGILIKGAGVLEQIHKVDTLIMDKTGTLTHGRMFVTDVRVVSDDMSEDEALAYACALESGSEHPIAQAFAREATRRSFTCESVTDFSAYAGKGVSGRLSSGLSLALGTLDWAEELCREDSVDDVKHTGHAREVARQLARSGRTVSVLVVDSRIVALFAVGDTVREESLEVMAQLREYSIRPVIATGDNKETAQAIAAQVGISEVHANLSPEDKVALVRELRGSAHTVVMVGDGVNDAPALAGADVSIAMGSGTDVAQASSDITIVNSSLLSIPAAIRISRRTFRIIKENLAWAFGYNLLAIPLAMAGIIVPGVAAAAMASSSVIVVLNSLRLKKA